MNVEEEIETALVEIFWLFWILVVSNNKRSCGLNQVHSVQTSFNVKLVWPINTVKSILSFLGEIQKPFLNVFKWNTSSLNINDRT